MFELELYELLNNLKKTSQEYEIKKIKNSISNLIKQNPDKYSQFLQTQPIENNTLKTLKECKENIHNEKEETIANNETNDFEIIKKYYLKWLEFYNNNNKIPNKNNEKIIFDIINFYANNRFEVIEQILKIEDDENFEAFKNMLKNYLRKYFAEKVLNYFKSDNFTALKFFVKREKKNQMLNILDEIGAYRFNVKKINKVLS